MLAKSTSPMTKEDVNTAINSDTDDVNYYYAVINEDMNEDERNNESIKSLWQRIQVYNGKNDVNYNNKDNHGD